MVRKVIGSCGSAKADDQDRDTAERICTWVGRLYPGLIHDPVNIGPSSCDASITRDVPVKSAWGRADVRGDDVVCSQLWLDQAAGFDVLLLADVERRAVRAMHPRATRTKVRRLTPITRSGSSNGTNRRAVI